MLHDYLGFVVMFGLALVVGLALALLSTFAGPKRNRETKLMPYESGMDPVGTARERFSVKFYLIAMLFIVFDIEIVFMYPWAVNFQRMLDLFGFYPYIEMLVFMIILFAGYIYVYKKGGLDWE
jgi:NADH-quinone oxidoreductase subunit A